jgi:hypothetical protein
MTTTTTPRIDETINFLEDYFPSDLAELKACNPELVKVLEADWAGVTSPATRLRAEATLRALKGLLPTLAGLLNKTVHRVRAARRAEDAAALVTVASTISTAVLTAIPAVPLWLKLAPAFLAAGASVWTLRSKQLGRTLFDKGIGEQAAVIADAQVAVPQLITDLNAYLDTSDPQDYSARVDGLLERANALFREVNQIRSEHDTR